jgi:hypothetical protein
MFPELCDLHELMPNGQASGYAFSARPGGGWVAEPVAPGLTGSDTILCDGSVRPAPPPSAQRALCEASVIPTPGAEAAQARAMRRILGHGARLIGSLMVGRPEVVAGIREGQLLGVRDVERELDQNGDGSLSLGEVLAWSVDEDPRVAEFVGQVAAELRLGAGGEDVLSLLLPAVRAGVPTPFDYATLRILTRDAVHDRRAEAWLVFWLRYAEWAVSRGDVDAESFAVGRYLRRLEPELLRSVTITDGTSLEQILLATASEPPQPTHRQRRR